MTTSQESKEKEEKELCPHGSPFSACDSCKTYGAPCKHGNQIGRTGVCRICFPDLSVTALYTQSARPPHKRMIL